MSLLSNVLNFFICPKAPNLNKEMVNFTLGESVDYAFQGVCIFSNKEIYPASYMQVYYGLEEDELVLYRVHYYKGRPVHYEEYRVETSFLDVQSLILKELELFGKSTYQYSFTLNQIGVSVKKSQIRDLKLGVESTDASLEKSEGETNFITLYFDTKEKSDAFLRSLTYFISIKTK